MSHEEISEVDFFLDHNLLHYDGDKVTLQWNPSDIINPDLVDPTSYSVDVEVYWYNVNNSTWNFLQDLVDNLNNTGVAEGLSDVLAGPESIEEYTVPIVFRIVPSINDASLIPDFLLPLLEQRQIGIWSSVAYKVTKSSAEHTVPGICRDWIAQETRSTVDILSASIPCPCTVRQAKRVNSGLFELRSERHDSMRNFFNPGARNCFVSISLGYVEFAVSHHWSCSSAIIMAIIKSCWVINVQLMLADLILSPGREIAKIKNPCTN